MASKKKAASEEVVTAYKGFKQDLTCRIRGSARRSLHLP
ncbi:hypothetical protein Q049_06290 [Pseudomonas aeruginosa BWHPSA044]|nr:hypothetical protein Q049_06290 [Pseudomonas aeruginosa BWHPSA044]